jgi:hypothetical protein
MKPVLLSTAYFPPVSWMAAAVQSGSIQIENHETYPKQTFRNRCNIATSSGILSLTVPVNRVNGNHTKTCDIRIDNSVNWQMLHWRSIVTAYNKSPYFLYYRDIVEPIFLKKHESLIDLNTEVLKSILHALKIKNIDILYTDQYETKPDLYDLRNSFHPKLNQRQEITYNLPRYIQTFEEKNGFVADLSIIDLLFNLGPDTLPYLAKVEFSLQD